ncbi:MAG: glycerol-3-phosphate dehydrogenase (NAD(P)+) [Alphaproteobacteria bacterium]|jgi:glycerol-3-phosphate dehydrogenase (NAD(P)+)
MAHITILGSGAWGTALGQILSLNHTVTIWGRSSDKITGYAQSSQHSALKGVILSSKIHWTSCINNALEKAEIIILSIPTQHCRDALHKIHPLIKHHIPLIQTAKGIEIETGLFTPQITHDIFPNNPNFLLSGPGFAIDLAHLRPTAVSLASMSHHKDTIQLIQDLFLQTPLRPYHQTDMMGVALGGALKNVLAIAAGFCIGHNLGEGAKSAIITRGFNEMILLAKALKADSQTLYGLSGLGDLMLTANSMTSRNYQYGHALGHNETMNLSDATVEGYHTLLALEKKVTLDVQNYPIFSALSDLIGQRKSKAEIIAHLLDRPFKEEF